MKIVAGRAKTGKTSYIYEQIKNELNCGSKCNLVLIVPELMTYQNEIDIIEKFDLDGIMDVQILSFKKLESNILQEVEGIKKQNINIYGKIMVLKQVFIENKDKLHIFHDSSRKEGFLKEIVNLIQELKQNLITPELLNEASKNIDNEILKKKLHDVELIYEKYNEKTSCNYFDDEDKTDLFAEVIKQSSFIKNSKIWIDGFESFSRQRLNIIKNLADYSKSLTLSLNIDPLYLNNLEENDDWEAFKTISDTYNSINKLMGNIVEVIALMDNKIESQEINALEKNIFSINIEKFEKESKNINISSSLNPYSETQKVAAKIISLVRDHNYRWKDIKIAVGSMDVYVPNIKKIFAQHNIPYFLDAKRDIMGNPLTKYVVSLLDLFDSRFKHDKVFEYLKTELTPLNYYQVNLLENYALKYGIEGEKWFKPFEKLDTKHLSDEDIENSDTETDELNSKSSFATEDYRKLFTEDFKNRKEIEKLNTVNTITNAIFEYLKKHDIQEKINKSVTSFVARGQFEQASEFSQAWNFLMEIFEQLLLIGGNEKITLKEYKDMLEAGLKEVQISIIPPTIDNVEIGDVDRIAVNKSKVLFLMGANQNYIDSKNSESGIILGDERDMLIENKVSLVKDSSYNDFMNKHLMYKLFSSPKERLYMSYALGNQNGEGIFPSTYVDIIKKIFPLVKEESDLSNDNQMDLVSNYSGTYESFVENIRNFIDGYDIDSLWKDVYAWYDKNDHEKFQIIKDGFRFNNKVTSIKQDQVNKIYEDNMSMTVSKLENYASCKYKYFLENVVKPRKREIQKIEYNHLGDIYHLFMESFGDYLIEQKNIKVLEKEEIHKKSEEILKEVYKQTENKVTSIEANNRNRYMKEKIQRVMKRTAWTIVRQLKSGEFRPKYTELMIDLINEENETKSYIDPIELKVKVNEIEKTMKLRGKIDRVDVYENPDDGKKYVIIIDYKSSYKDIDIDDANEGLQVQLLVYLKALIHNSKKLFGEEALVGGVFYYHMDDPIISGNYDAFIAESEIFKKLKLKGYVLGDLDIVKKIDMNIGSSSDIISAGITKNGELSKNTKALTKDEFSNLMEGIFKKCKEMTKNILEGNIDINPYKKSDGTTPCSYCEFMSICQFDKTLGNTYHMIYKKPKDDSSTKGGN